jgi:hypothetical protein
MPYNHLDEFCGDVCRVLGVAKPELAAAEGAPPAFGIMYKETAIGVMQASLDDAAHAVLLVDYGPLDESSAEQVCRTLLQANFLMAGGSAPSFGLNPATDHVVYQAGFALGDANAVSFCAEIDRLAVSVGEWRDGRMFEPAPSGDAPSDKQAFA